MARGHGAGDLGRWAARIKRLRNSIVIDVIYTYIFYCFARIFLNIVDRYDLNSQHIDSMIIVYF